MSQSLRPATPEDISSISAIEKKIQSDAWTDVRLRKLLGDDKAQHFWVMTDDETDEKIYGYLGFDYVTLPSATGLERQCQLLRLGVINEQRGLGHASEMLQKMISQCLKDGVLTVTAWVNASANGALGLLQKTGFDIVQKQKASKTGEEARWRLELSIHQAVPSVWKRHD